MRRERDWDRVSDFYRAGSDSDGTYAIDDRTWADLGLQGVFDIVDHTLSGPGEQVLYARLRRPAINADRLAERRRLPDLFAAAPATCAAVRQELTALGVNDGDGLAALLWRSGDRRPFSPARYRVGTLAAVVAVGLLIAGYWLVGAVALLAAVTYNFNLHNRARLATDSDTVALRYLPRLLRATRALRRKGVLPPEQAELFARVDGATRGLRRKLATLSLLTSRLFDDLLGTLNVMFLVEAHTYLATFGDLVRLRPLLREAFAALGALDCAQSLVAARADTGWVDPVVTAGDGGPVFTELVHPLIAEPVANSVELRAGGLVITGSNMSGKSTFLRAVGIAVVLAQGIALVRAGGYRGGFFRVRSVMSAADDLRGRKSYYLDEAQAVLRAIEGASEEPPLLCIFDELFRGTNSTERVSAGVSVVRWIVARRSVTVLATHDLETARQLDGALVNVHFEDRPGEHGIAFDHVLRPGPAMRTNALDLLAHVGYPAELVDEARRIAATRS